jgi:hypothetical protein
VACQAIRTSDPQDPDFTDLAFLKRPEHGAALGAEPAIPSAGARLRRAADWFRVSDSRGERFPLARVCDACPLAPSLRLGK